MGPDLDNPASGGALYMGPDLDRRSLYSNRKLLLPEVVFVV